MRIAAIYIEDHEYLFKTPQTVNFGGKYFYDFTKSNKKIIVTRTINEKYISDFFNLTASLSKITHLNAIVGQNGAGKSTLLDVIRSRFIKNKNALPLCECLILIEEENSDLPVILCNDFGNVYIADADGNKTSQRVELKPALNNDIQTIYYSPHFDFKYNPDFSDIDFYDLSFDKILELDLKELNEKDSNDHGWPYSPNQELLFKNSLRQIKFLSSDLVARQKIFKDIFNLPEHYEPLLEFRAYKKQEREWNTPNAFRRILNIIDEKAEEELNNWHNIRKFKKDQVTNQVEVNRYILKRNVIKCILSLLYRQMEKKNDFLDKGFFPFKQLEQKIIDADALGSLMLFIENAEIKFPNSKGVKVFEELHLFNLIRKIYESIDSAQHEDSVSNNSLKTSKRDAIEILELQRLFLRELNDYYLKFYAYDDSLIRSFERIEEFVNYMPFSQQLSSGEHALLNFYSRIYDFFQSRLIEPSKKKLHDHYVLLLDEADLMFHPEWKKRYVNALLNTLPYFFDLFDTKPSFQIIFTTHDPLALSDLPNPNVIYIERNDYSSVSRILSYNDLSRPRKTFGANISELLSDSFFLKKSLIGEFAFNTIQKTIEWLNNKADMQDSAKYEKIIQLVDEPIVRRKLSEMYDDKMRTTLQLKIVNDEIRRLELLKQRLEK